MPRESKKAKAERAVEVCRRLDKKYGPVECFLDHTNPFRLVISVLLSAQTTDAQVNRVTPELFRRFPTPEAMAAASPEEVAEIIRSLGFYKTKARHCVEAAQAIVADFGGEVPHTMAELTSLSGVGRKTANIVLNVSFGIVEGIAVDTHVFRIATRLGFTKAAEPLDAEQDLLKLIPRELWKPVNHQWVLFGRQVCDARKPACLAADAGEAATTPGGMPCPLADLCPSCGKPPKTKAQARKAAGTKKAGSAKAAGKKKTPSPK